MGAVNLLVDLTSEAPVLPVRSAVAICGGGEIQKNRHTTALYEYDATPDGMRAIVAALFLDPAYPADTAYVRRRYASSIAPGAWESLAAARFRRPGLEPPPTPSSTRAYRRIAVPVLVVEGAGDKLLPAGWAAEIAGQITGARCAIVEGAVALEVVLRAGVPLRSLLLTRARAESMAPLLARRAADVPLFVADRDVLAEVVGFDLHRGVLASAERRPPPPADEVLGSCSRVVVAEGLNDHENLGALFRNAAALDIDAVLLDDRTADPLYRRCIRVSSGWAAVLPHARLGALPGGYDRLRSHGFRVVALTPSPDALAADRAAAAGWLDDRVALVVGAEGPGLAPASIAGADAAVRIPMAPGVDSLNVATSLAVVAAFAAARRQWR